MLKCACLFWVFCIGLIAYPFAIYSESKCSVNPVYVYKPDGTRHCVSNTAIKLDTMEQELISTGIKVISKKKGFDSREGIALCGAPTGQINIYEICTSDLSAAMRQGFVMLSEE